VVCKVYSFQSCIKRSYGEVEVQPRTADPFKCLMPAASRAVSKSRRRLGGINVAERAVRLADTVERYRPAILPSLSQTFLGM
jgi:hypothetical protein